MGVDQILMVKPTLDGTQPACRACAPSDDATSPGASFLGALPFTVLAVVVVLGGTFLVALRLRPARGRRRRLGPRLRGRRGRGVPGRPRARATASSAASRSCSRCVWGVRLAVHIALRSRGHGEDPRYVELLGQGARQPAAVRAAPDLPHPGRGDVVRLAAGAGGDVQRRARPTLATWVGVAALAGRLRLRDRRRPAAHPLPQRPVHPGPGARHRPVALHPAPELLRRRLRLVGPVPDRVQRLAGHPHDPVAAG